MYTFIEVRMRIIDEESIKCFKNEFPANKYLLEIQKDIPNISYLGWDVNTNELVLVGRFDTKTTTELFLLNRFANDLENLLNYIFDLFAFSKMFIKFAKKKKTLEKNYSEILKEINESIVEIKNKKVEISAIEKLKIEERNQNEEKEELFDVFLENFDADKIDVFLENFLTFCDKYKIDLKKVQPGLIETQVSKDEAKAIEKFFSRLGAKVTLKPSRQP